MVVKKVMRALRLAIKGGIIVPESANVPLQRSVLAALLIIRL